MKIIQLTIENVKRVSVVSITPQGNLIAIGGKNESGKSSVLDAIWYALGGERNIPTNPVRRGEKKGKVELDLGELIVTRTFTATGGGSLTVKNKDNVTQTGPQAILDKLCAQISFDPLKFATQKEDEQSKTLKALLGLDFKDEDRSLAALSLERTGVNREAKALQARLLAAPEYSDVTATEEQSATDIMKEQTKAADRNKGNAERRQEARDFAEDYNQQVKNMESAQDKIHETKALLAQLEAKEVEIRGMVEAARPAIEERLKAAAALVDEDLAPFQEKVAQVEQVNAKIRCNKVKTELRAQSRAKDKESDALTAKIEAIESKKQQALLDAKFPVEGLGLDNAGNVTFGGIAFAEVNTATKIRVSVAIGLALNKDLKVLLVRQGSELDPENRAMMADMAAKADAQVWFETSRTDAPVSVVMEDGHVQSEPETKPEITPGVAAPTQTQLV